MSFSDKVKNELADLPVGDSDRALAELSAIFSACGSIGMVKSGYYAEFVGGDAARRRADKLTESLYGVKSDEERRVSVLKSGVGAFKLTGDTAFKLLEDCGRVYRDGEGLLRVRGGIDRYLVMEEEQARGFLAGAFIAAGSVSADADYHFEVALPDETLADDLSDLFGRFSIKVKRTLRSGKNIVYLKESGAICDALALMNASEAVLELNRVMAERLLRRGVNRQANCIESNIGRSVAVASEQAEAVKKLRAAGAFDALPPPLRELCDLRLKFPELPLADLGGKLKNPLGKSGVCRRFRKITAAAEKI